MENCIKYNIGFIYLFKDIKDEQKEKEILNFIKNLINNDNIKTICYDKNIDLYDNKWYRKKYVSDMEKLDKKLNSLLNKYSINNFENITLKILKLKISNIEEINLVIKKIPSFALEVKQVKLAFTPCG